jgi:hypothetical protein
MWACVALVALSTALGAAAAPHHRPGRPPHPHQRSGKNEDGPGAGDWQRRAPAELGLDGPALDRVEEYVNEEMAGRQCFMVVKDGYIVKETYRLGHTESSVRK